MPNRYFAPTLAALLIFVSGTVYAQDSEIPSGESEQVLEKAESNWRSNERQAALRVQLFLDQEGFGPGKLDGRWGEFSKKAAERWNAAGNGPEVVITDDGSLNLEKAQGLPLSGSITTTYEITAEDQSLLGNFPNGPEEKAKLDALPYSTLIELIAEKFHADPDLIMEMNELDSEDDLKVGGKIKVPNVSEPFDLSEPKKLAEQAEKEKKTENDAEKSQESPYALTVLREAGIVEVREGGKLLYSFPITTGASGNESPAGDWTVGSVTWMPEFRWDKSMLEDGTRSNDAHLLPPGPNNPVGIVWIALSADGIGLHGTPFPGTIGRGSSHGCIRLSNWDALKLGKKIGKGTSVTIK